MENDQTKPSIEIKEVDAFTMIIPECCREGWENCPHVINRPKKPAKRNIGL